MSHPAVVDQGEVGIVVPPLTVCQLLPDEAATLPVVRLAVTRVAFVDDIVDHREAQGDAILVLRDVVRQRIVSDLGSRPLAG